MNKRTAQLSSYVQTVGVVFSAAKKYKSDLGRFANSNVLDFYEYLRSLPYREDPEGIEHISRPKYTLDPNWQGPRDCDDKTLAAATFFEANRLNYRIVVSGKKRNAHHIYPELETYTAGPDGKKKTVWMPYDATYPDCHFGERLFREGFRDVFYPDGSNWQRFFDELRV